MATTERSKTATPAQGVKIIGTVLVVVAALGYAVLPMMDPGRSKLVGVPAPEFTLPVMHNGEPGSRVALSDYRGKAVVLDFWASWCAPCRAQAPIIDRVAQRRDGKDVAVLGISTSGDDWARAVRFAQANDLHYTTLYDEEDRVGAAFKVRTLPTLVVLNSKGEITAVRTRVVKEEELDELIDEAVAQGAS